MDGLQTPGTSRWARLPRWRRAAWRLGVPVVLLAVVCGYATHPRATLAAGAVLAVPGTRGLRRWWRTRRFRRTYTKPTLGALRSALGDAPLSLRVDPSLGNLVTRMAKPLSPVEVAVRAWYGTRVEPVLRWVPERVMRGAWWAQRSARPVTSRIAVALRRPVEDHGPRIELQASVPYLTSEQRAYVSSVLTAKIPAGELVESWDQVGSKVSARWTVRRRPPSRVGYADLAARIDQLAEDEFFLGLGVGGKPVTVSLALDSPHIAVSAGTGAGKSVLAALVGVQVLARGGRVVILDLKGSHRWALGLPGVDYCTEPSSMHAALVRLAEIADQRNREALHQPEGWDPGERVLLIAEELNATFALLRDYWAETREKSDPKVSPAVRAFRFILFTGRSAKINEFAVAQLLTAQTTGGPESRENFGIRCLARYTTNAWKMLVPEAAMPRASRTLGRWQVVVGGAAKEVQVCYLTAAEARLLVHKMSPGGHSPLMAPDQGLSPGHGPVRDTVADPLSELVTLRDASARGIVPWKFEAAKKRLQRARAAEKPDVPAPVDRDGLADRYRVGDLVIWAESELIP